jgi:hypothetical protein
MNTAGPERGCPSRSNQDSTGAWNAPESRPEVGALRLGQPRSAPELARGAQMKQVRDFRLSLENFLQNGDPISSLGQRACRLETKAGNGVMPLFGDLDDSMASRLLLLAFDLA